MDRTSSGSYYVIDLSMPFALTSRPVKYLRRISPRIWGQIVNMSHPVSLHVINLDSE
jgi:hypothetical protein